MSKDVNSELDKLEKQEELKGSAKFFKFVNEGDSIQGTLMNRFRATSQLGQDQVIYVVKNDEGIWNVAFNVTYTPVHRELAHAKVGQVVRFTFTGSKPHRIKGYNPVRIIRVISRPDLMDASAAEWLADYGFEFGSELPQVMDLPEDEETTVEEEVAEPAKASRPLGGSIPRS